MMRFVLLRIFQFPIKLIALRNKIALFLIVRNLHICRADFIFAATHDFKPYINVRRHTIIIR